MLVVIIISSVAIIIVQGRLERLALGGFPFGGFVRRSLALRGLAFAHFAMVFPGIENQMQPGHHLLDRRQLAGRSGFAARTRRTLRAGLALRTSLAARTSRADLALRAGLAVRAGLAARAFEAGRSGVSLRPRASRLAARTLWSLSSLLGWIFGQLHTPPVSMTAVSYQTLDDGFNYACARPVAINRRVSSHPTSPAG